MLDQIGWQLGIENGGSWTTEATREFTWDETVRYEALGLLNGPEVVQSGDEYRHYYGSWGDGGAAAAPSGSCAYVWSKGAIVPTDGVYGLNLATRRAP